MSDTDQDSLNARHLKQLRAAGYSTVTIASRLRLLRHADRYLPYGLGEADRDDLTEYLAEDGWSRWTRHTYDAHLRGYYKWAVEVEEIELNPMERMPRPRGGECIPDPVTDDELRIALARSPRQPWGMATMLAAYAGLRGSESARLLREDITKDYVRIRNGKGGRDALVETAPQLWDFVRSEAPGRLVRSTAGRPMTGAYLIGFQHRHWRALGMPNLHLHRFRHWYGTSLLSAGNDLRTVQELMRHKNISSTAGYTLVVSDQRRRAINTLPAIAGVAA